MDVKLGAKTINVFRACLGAQLTICAQCHELPGEANRTSKRKRGDMGNKEYMEAIKEQTQNG